MNVTWEQQMSAVIDRTAELEALHADIARKNMFPFWAATAGPGHDEVKRLMGAAPRAVPFLWSYAEFRRTPCRTNRRRRNCARGRRTRIRLPLAAE